MVLKVDSSLDGIFVLAYLSAGFQLHSQLHLKSDAQGEAVLPVHMRGHGCNASNAEPIKFFFLMHLLIITSRRQTGRREMRSCWQDLLVHSSFSLETVKCVPSLEVMGFVCFFLAFYFFFFFCLVLLFYFCLSGSFSFFSFSYFFIFIFIFLSLWRQSKRLKSNP